MEEFKKCRIAILFLLPVYLLSCSAFPNRQRLETGFLDRTGVVGYKSHKYQVYIPEDYATKQKWPIILSLHGMSERGNDGLLQINVGLGKAVRQNRASFPAIIVFPQCSPGSMWFGEMQDLAIMALENTMREFHGDSKRIYLTGLSMGAAGSWYLAMKYPKKFAALVPIAGGVVPPPGIPFPFGMPDEMKNLLNSTDPYTMAAQKIGKTPVWIFHGEKDDVVPIVQAKQLAKALGAVNENVHYTEYKGEGHNVWDKAYVDQEMKTWLFSQHLEE